MSVYEIITGKIIEKLEQGTAPWTRPWSGGQLPRNLVTGKTYRGINLFLLNMANYASPYWLTYRQCQEKGGQVKKGERSSQVVFWQLPEKGAKEQDDEGEEGTGRKAPLLRYYCVFNAEQCDGLDIPQLEQEAREFSPLEACEALIHGMPANSPEIRHNEQKAYYVPSMDYVNMPKPETFRSSEEYYSTLFHELTHSTGHSSRLSRKGITVHNGFGSADYGKEELVAEMGAAFLCGCTGIENLIDNSSAYIAGWLKAIREDKKIVITAAAAAQKAVDYILNKQQQAL
jgi:antirestriction protein ArdC